MRKPNLFIIGAPKCGTTALSTYLGRHPAVFMSDPKEPHYFCTDFPKMRTVSTESNYEDLFREVKECHKIVGEASVWYLYSTDAVANLFKYNPNAQIIVMLRNPVDLVHSMHSQNINSADEDVKDFKKAWELQELRIKGHKIPKHCREPAKLLYGKFGKLGEQVAALLQIVPEDQIKFVVFDEFIRDTENIFNDVLKFLSLEPVSEIEFEPINQNEAPRSLLLTRLTRRPPSGLVAISQSFKKMLGMEKLGVIDLLMRINLVTRKRRPLDDRFRAQLIEYFAEDISKLSTYINKDLGAWLESR